MIDLITFKQFIRQIDSDLDDVASLSLAAGQAEAEAHLGYKIAEKFDDNPPSDLAMAVLLLGQCHFDAGDPATNQYRRGAAQKLLFPYRADSGVVAG